MALVLASSLVTTAPAWAGAKTSSTTPVLSPGANQHVSYRGVELDVPGGWTVVDLTADPTACVRFDVHVVYLGTPGAVQQCPAVLVGRTEAIVIQPRPSELPFGTTTLVPGAVPQLTSGQLQASEVVAQVSGTDTVLTASFATDPALAVDVLRSLTVPVTAAAPRAPALPATNAPLAPSALAAPSAPLGATVPLTATTPLAPSAATADPPPLDRSFTWHYGLGFDACTAPALNTMSAWRASSPYRSIGIYVGGASRGCAQANLTASWVRSIAAMGWKAQPIYVGLQAPCSPFNARIAPGQEWPQGHSAALDAIVQARALGIGRGSDIYYDMEAYARSTSCSGSVRAFLSSWSSTLQFNGYSAGVYSSLSSGIADLANGAAQPGFVPPNKIWIASWNVPQSVYGFAPYVADNQWFPYSRMHQYLGGHDESYGAVSINIDGDFLDTDPNRGSPVGQVDSTRIGPSKVTASGWALDPDTSAPIIVQMYVDGRANALTWANLSRPDVGAVFPAAGPAHGYSLTMQTTPGPHTLCLYAINVGPGFSRSLGCRAVNVASSSPFGQIDAVTTAPTMVTASGWAIDPDTSAPIIVQMYVDNRANALTWANQSRPDVGAAYPAAGPNHGYSLTMATTRGLHTVCLFGVNTGLGTSRQIGCRVVAVP